MRRNLDRLRREWAARVVGVRSLQWGAVTVALGFVGLIALFVGGDAVVSPGGWVGIGGTAAWVLATLGLCLLAFYRPTAAMVVLAVAACAPLAFGAWSLVDYAAAREWEDSHGPLSLVLVLSVCGPAAVAGLFHPHAAGYLILTVTVVPLLLAAVGVGSNFSEPLTVGLLLVPLVGSGVLFLLSGRHQDRAHPLLKAS